MSVTNKIHDHLCRRISYYKNWHNVRTSNYIHIFLLLFAFALAIGITTNEISILNHVKAGNKYKYDQITPNYNISEDNTDKITLNYTVSGLSPEGYLNLSWDSSEDVEYLSIYVIDYRNNVEKIADKIKNRNYFSAYLAQPDYQIIQFIGYSQDNKEIANQHFQL